MATVTSRLGRSMTSCTSDPCFFSSACAAAPQLCHLGIRVNQRVTEPEYFKPETPQAPSRRRARLSRTR